MFSHSGQILQWTHNHETLQLQPWGPGCIRVRITMEPALTANQWALIEPPPADAVVTVTDDGARMVNGDLSAEIASDGHIR